MKTQRGKTKLYHGSLKGINEYLNSHSTLAFAQDEGANPFSVDVEYKFGLEDMGNGRKCVMLEKVRAYYRSSPRIVMPSDFRKGSCEYKLILEHEKRHVKVFDDYFYANEGRFAAFLGRIARDVPVGPPVKTQDHIQEIRNHIMEYFEIEFRTLTFKAFIDMMKRQEKIDSQQEYTFTNRKIDRCKEERRNKNKKTKKSIRVYDD